MFTWCTETEWCDDTFDLDYALYEHGTFNSTEECVADYKKHGYEYAVVLSVD